jgi:hypothetical protein
MLGVVLNALTESGGLPPSDWLQLRTAALTLSPTGARIVAPRLNGGGRRADYDMRYAWTPASVAEACELLDARGLIPTGYAARFVCETCGGTGAVAAREVGPGWNAACPDCDDGHRPHPPTIAALASWASLGFAAGDDGAPGILGAEELMGELSPGTPTRWRVTPVTDIPTDFFRNESARRLNAAGFGWSGAGRYRTLYVPPLGPT